MIEALNIVACAVLFALVWRVAVAVHRWRHRAPVLAVTVVLGMQLVDPLARWLPAVLWTTVAVNVTLAVMAVLWRRELWALVRCKLGLDEPPDCEQCPMRRSSDFVGLDERPAAGVRQSYGGSA